MILKWRAGNSELRAIITEEAQCRGKITVATYTDEEVEEFFVILL